MHIKHLIASLFCLAALASPWAHAATLEGQTFDSSVRLAGQDRGSTDWACVPFW